MRCRPAVLLALVFGAAATVPAFGDCVGQRVRAQGSRGDRRLHAQRFDQLREDQAGRGYGLDYSQSGWKLDVFIYDLKRAAIPDDAKSAIVRAEFERARADAFLAPAARALRPGLSAAELHHRRRGEAHAVPVRGVSSDPRRREAPGRLSLRHRLEQQVRQASPDDAQRQQHRGERAQVRHRLDSGAVGRRRSRAEQVKPEPEPQATRRSAACAAAPPRRAGDPPAERVPENYICEMR